MDDFLVCSIMGAWSSPTGTVVALKGSNVRCLADWVCEEAHWNAGLKVAHLNLGFYGRIALEAWIRSPNPYGKNVISAQLRHL